LFDVGMPQKLSSLLRQMTKVSRVHPQFTLSGAGLVERADLVEV